MALGTLMEGLASVPDPHAEIRDLALDSRRVQPGALFFALAGSQADGADFIADAARRGAVACVTDAASVAPPTGHPIPVIRVPELRPKVGLLADRFFDEPSADMLSVGVTGTNGKSTFVHMFAKACDRLGFRCGQIGTLGHGLGSDIANTGLTTPDAISIHRVLAMLRDEGATHVAMEVSSHALVQHRVSGVRFVVAVLTGIGRDHLDYHGSWEAYAEAKSRLFDFPTLQSIVYPVEHRQRIASRVGKGVLQLSFGKQGEVRARNVEFSLEATRFELEIQGESVPVVTSLIGEFNVRNTLAVAAALVGLGIPLRDVADALAGMDAPRGRLEQLVPRVFIDFAHTPDALAAALGALRALTRERLWVVFGCGGDRDRGKRPQMGAIAERLADAVVLCDDNPRGEDRERILDDIAAGMRGDVELHRIPDRAQALAFAWRAKGPQDVLLVAGKGHEAYQIVGAQRQPFSDHRVLLELAGQRA